MKKIEIGELFKSLERLGFDQNEIFSTQTIKIIQRDWKEIVGDFFGDQSYPAELKENRLIVMCKHSLISQEMEFQKMAILQKLTDKKLPTNISKIVLKTGIVPNSKRTSS